MAVHGAGVGGLTLAVKNSYAMHHRGGGSPVMVLPVPPYGIVLAVTCVVVGREFSTTCSTCRQKRKEGKACQEPSRALGAFRKRSVEEVCRVTFYMGERATSPVVLQRVK